MLLCIHPCNALGDSGRFQPADAIRDLCHNIADVIHALMLLLKADPGPRREPQRHAQRAPVLLAVHTSHSR